MKISDLNKENCFYIKTEEDIERILNLYIYLYDRDKDRPDYLVSSCFKIAQGLFVLSRSGRLSDYWEDRLEDLDYRAGTTDQRRNLAYYANIPDDSNDYYYDSEVKHIIDIFL